MKIKDLHPNSKLWIYASDRMLSPTEIEWLNEQLSTFAQNWASHGTNLIAAAEVLNPYFIAFAVDLSHENASGCSIDKSVRIAKELGKELSVDFFNRMKVWIKDDSNEIIQVHFSKVSNYPNCLIFNPLIDKLGQLEKEFLVPIQEFIKMKTLV